MSKPAYALDFERPLLALESKIAELKELSNGPTAKVDFTDEIAKLEKKAKRLQTEIFSDLGRWQQVQLARHPNRPYTLDYLGRLFTDFFEVEGDRRFAADRAIVGGFARFDGQPVVVIGHQKGRSTKENMLRNFGMPRPEGYRKARRLFDLANRFRRPVITFIDTPGAYPGIGAEERGQAEAIARSTDACLALTVPNVAIITGEGMSGGAIAITTANKVLMLEHAIYSVISPEAASSILWRDGTKAQEAANSMKITAQDMLRFGVIDQILKEPPGGAHRDPAAMIASTGDAIAQAFNDLRNLDADAVRKQRRQKFLDIGRKLG